MKDKYVYSLIAALSLCGTLQLSAQVPDGLKKGNLQEQFDYLVNESSRYQTFKVVQQTWLDTFWGSVKDSLLANERSLRGNRSQLSTQEAEIEQLKTEVAEAQATIESLQQEKNSLSLLGITLPKSVYHILAWSIIAALTVGLVLYVGRFRYAHTVTRQVRKDNEELQERVTQLRKRMLEKEQELRRQLQDEINKRLG